MNFKKHWVKDLISKVFSFIINFRLFPKCIPEKLDQAVAQGVKNRTTIKLSKRQEQQSRNRRQKRTECRSTWSDQNLNVDQSATSKPHQLAISKRIIHDDAINQSIFPITSVVMKPKPRIRPVQIKKFSRRSRIINHRNYMGQEESGSAAWQA